MLTATILKNHIDSLEKGDFDFSEVELNNRADLVRFYDFTIEEALKVSEEDMYKIFDTEEGCNNSNDNKWSITCSNCGELLHMEYTSNPQDGYITTCNCGHKGFISVYEVDSLVNANSIDSQECDEVKSLEGKCWTILGYFSKKEGIPSLLKEVKTKGRLVQEIESFEDDIITYYFYNDVYYISEIDFLGRGEFKCLKVSA